MGIEIERKYLVKRDSWKNHTEDGLSCKQGYLYADVEKTIRVRIMGEKAYLTVKGKSAGISRSEFEYEIPVSDASDLMNLCDNIIEKTRYLIQHKGMIWELDIFEGSNNGLMIAEIELESEDQHFEFPNWVGKEVSDDSRYYNACLARNPFSTWSS